MSKQQSILIVGAREAEEEVLRRQISDVATIEQVEADPSRGLEALRKVSPSVVLLFLDHQPEAILSLSEQIARGAYSPSIMVSRNRDPDQILMAMRAGARDFAYIDESSNDVRRAIEGLGAGDVAVSSKRQGTVTSVFSAKGGCGATTIATNLAGALLTHGDDARVVILDIDSELGDVLVFLDLASRYSWVELLNNIHRLDDELVHRSLTAHSSGLRVLAQSDHLDEADPITGDDVTRTIQFLRKHYDHVVVDGLRGFSETSLAALDTSDRILLTMTQDIPALKNANRCLTLFGRLGYTGDKVRLVLNRYHKREKLDLDSIADALGTDVHSTVANDYPTVIRAINEGELLTTAAPRARVTKDVCSVLPAIGVRGGTSARRSLFGRNR